MLKRTLTGLVILLVTAGFVLLKQINCLFFDAFVLIVMYGALIEVIKAYKMVNAKSHTVALLFVPAMMFVAISIVKHIYADYFYNIEKLCYAILITFIIITVVALTTAVAVLIGTILLKRKHN